MTQQMLFAQDAPRRRKKAVNVPASSVAAYFETCRDGRLKQSILELEAFWFVYADHPTSAELAGWIQLGDRSKLSGLGVLLTVRRALSDGLDKGILEHAPARKCAVSGRTCLTWKIRTR